MAIAFTQILAYAEDLTEPQTTAGFNTVAGRVYLLIFHSDETSDGDGGGLTGVTITDNQTPDLTYNLIAQRGADINNSEAGYVGAWWFNPGDITGLTVTLDAVGAVGSGDVGVRVIEISGNVSTTDPVGASTGNTWTTDPQTTASITPETSGIGICAASDWNAASHSTTSSDLTIASFAFSSGNLDMCSGYKTLSAGVGATANLNAAATPNGNYIWFEIRDEGGAATKAPAFLPNRAPRVFSRRRLM